MGNRPLRRRSPLHRGVATGFAAWGMGLLPAPWGRGVPPFCQPNLPSAGASSLPGRRGSVFLEAEDFDFPLAWVAMRAAGLRDAGSGEEAEKLLVQVRRCAEGAGRGRGHLGGGCPGAAASDCRQRGRERDVLSEPSHEGQRFPRAGKGLPRPQLRSHRPFSIGKRSWGGGCGYLGLRTRASPWRLCQGLREPLR